MGEKLLRQRARLVTAIGANLPESRTPCSCWPFVAAGSVRSISIVRGVVSMGLALGAAGQAVAGTYTVTSAADDNTAGTLRAAVASANASPGSTVQFNPSLNGSTITLTNGQIPVTTAVAIQGPGANQLTISGNNTSRIFQVGSGGGQVTISGLTLSAGKSAGKGGAIYANNSRLTLQDMVLSGNSALDGGAIYAGGTGAVTTLTNATIQGNSANARGGIMLYHGTNVQISGSTITGNYAKQCCGGGYIGKLSGTATISNTQITNNHAKNGNGAGLALGGNTVQISGSTISGNIAYGAAYNGGGLWMYSAATTITSSHISGNQSAHYGGGVYFRDSSGAPAALDVERSTISGNTATLTGGGIAVGRTQLLTIGSSQLSGNRCTYYNTKGGGALFVSGGGPANLHDSTIYGNYAYGFGGGIDILGSLTGNGTTLTSMTIVGNSTQGNSSNGLRAAGTPTIDNSIIANNVNAANNAGSQDLTGTVKVTFSNIKKKGTATFAAGSGNNLADGTDPSLGLLAANGGPTSSMLPNAGSPVLDKGDTAIVSGVDQRGFPRVFGTHVDMGAVEFGSKMTTSTTLASSLNPSILNQNVTFTATVTGDSPTGNVTFKDGVTTICAAAALSTGSATCSTSTLAVGSHSITATYNGDSFNATSTSSALTQTVNSGAATTTTVVSSLNPSTFNQSVTFTATVTGQSPTGNVTFKDGATTICAAAALSAGSATCPTSTLSVASHSITATYNGDGNNSTSTSGVLTQTVNKAGSTTAVVSSANPSTFNQSVTFTATVTGQSPTGNVTFKDGATTICAAAALSAGSATCPTSTLTVGSHSITASYNGDGNNATSTSGTLSQTVNKASTTTTLGSSANPSTYNQSVTFTATVTGQSPTGNVTFKDGATTICAAAALSAGSATCPTSTLSVAGHSITATYNGDGNNATSTSGVLTQTVNKAGSTTAVVSSVNPSTFNQSVTFTATVTGQSPTGSVTFMDGATIICAAAALSAGSATCPTSTLTVGSHSITASYNGDGNNATSTSGALSQTVNKASTTTTLGSSVNPSTFNQSVTFTATVTGQSPTGNVTFKDGATTICAAAALSAGSATCPTSTLTVAGHSITATYNGDGNNATSTSSTLTQTVNKATTTTALISSLNPSALNQSVTFTATVTGQSPTGNVTFMDGATGICAAVPLSSGTATCPISTLSVGSHSITATYNGDGNNTGSLSATLIQNVVNATSSTVLASSLNPSVFNQSVTFTATVTGQSPTGNVTFKDGATTICAAAALSAGSATCSTSSLAAGSHSISAGYNGDGNNAASTSSVLTQTVNKATTTTSVVSSVNPSAFNQSVMFTATVTGQSPTGNVTFKDGAATICAAATLSAGTATCSTSALAVGSHSITAAYNGDGDNAASISGVLAQGTTTAGTTTTLSTPCMTTFVEGQPFTMNAGVTGANPSGGITFKDGVGTVYCSNVALSAGSAVCTTSNILVQGGGGESIYAMHADYSGDSSNASSTSGPLALTVLSAAEVVFRNGYEPESLSCPVE